MNRAIDGDIVAVEVLPKSQWQSLSIRLAPRERERVAAGINSESKDGKDAKDDTKTHARMTGRVVGIIKRNWRPYCGSFEVTDKKSGMSLHPTPLCWSLKASPQYDRVFCRVGHVLFLSVNKRIPKIRVDSRQIETLMDKRILVRSLIHSLNQPSPFTFSIIISVLVKYIYYYDIMI